MAVKHKECRDPKIDSRLNTIIRVLQNINSENGLHVSDFGRLCEIIVQSLGTFPLPTTTEEYKTFMSNIERIQQTLAKVCTSDELVSATLKAFYNGISDPQRKLYPTMSVVLQLIDTNKIPSAVQWILRSGYKEQNLEQALLTLCHWLSRWTFTPNLGPLVLCFMQGLEGCQYYNILIKVTLIYIEDLFKLVIIPEPRESVGPVVLYMLESMQHSTESFHKIIPHVGDVLSFLHKENSQSSQYYLHKFVNLFMALIDHFPGHPDLHNNLKRTLDLYQPEIDYKQILSRKSWLDENNLMVSLRTSGKVGLNNLGNTCYLNSVLQALFMTKSFRNNILLCHRETVPSLSKLQSLFALLQFSQRRSLSPSDILNLAIPPGFQPGHQHDSSEFLGYLLNLLDEDERKVSPTCIGDVHQPGPSSETARDSSIVQKSFGGRAETVSTCGSCRSESKRADSFRELQLSFPSNCDNQSVQTLLDYYLQTETLCGENQYHCDTCQGLTDGKRVTRIVKLPPCLILTLKHFRYNSFSQQRTKILQRVKLDAVVLLEQVPYRLYAAVVHYGSSVDSGHYYTFACDDSEWYKLNDSIVDRTKEEELCGLQPPETAYILFYSRQDCVDPHSLSIDRLPSRLQYVLEKDKKEFEAENKQLQIKINFGRNNKDDDPPPPGCGGGGFIDNSPNRFVC